MILTILQGLQQVVCLAPLVLGVWLSFIILRFPDFTPQGSFVLGGAVFAALSKLGHGTLGGAIFYLAGAGLAGAISGLTTGFFNTRLKVPTLLSGIGVSLICYTAALIAMSGAMLGINASHTLAGPFLVENAAIGRSRELISGYLALNATREAVIFGAIAILIYGVFRFILTSRVGLLLRASGLNPAACQIYGFGSEPWQLLGLALSNACAALSGALFSQNLRFADVGFGTGVIALSLGVVILAEGFRGQVGWSKRLILLVGGLAVFQAIRMIVLRLPLGSDYLRLAEGLMLLGAVALAARLRGRHPVWDLRL